MVDRKAQIGCYRLIEQIKVIGFPRFTWNDNCLQWAIKCGVIFLQALRVGNSDIILFKAKNESTPHGYNKPV